jgi:phosphoribosyl-AMP cyclohydrolase
MVLAQKQVRRPVDQNQRSVYESMHLCQHHFWQRAKNIWWSKGILLNKYCRES